MVPGEFEQLFTTSLSGIYQDNVLESGFKEFTNMILNPRLAQDRMRRIEEIIIPPPPSPEIPIAIPELPPPEVPLEIPLSSPSIATDDIFVGYPIPRIEVPIPSVSPPVPPESYVILFLYEYDITSFDKY